MRDYFLTLMTASVLGGVAALLASGSNYEKYIKYIAALICVVIIMSPLKGFISAPFKPPDISAELSGTAVDAQGSKLLLGEYTVSETDAYIKSILFAKFGINPHSTDIKIEWNEQKLVIKSLTVYLRASDSRMTGEAEEFLKNAVGGEIDVKTAPDGA